MNSVRFFLSIFLTSLFGVVTYCQSYEEEIGFTFVKAKYLLETDRYDDAVREFNRVINDNPSMENALALRALAKYKLSAFIGTKKDILKYIELKGVTPEAVSLLAKAEYQLTEFDAALNSLSTAISLVNDDPELLEFRASIYMDRDEKLKACDDWKAAAELGSSKALLTAKSNCGYQEVAEEPSIEDGGTLLTDSRDPGLLREDNIQGTFNEGSTYNGSVVNDPMTGSQQGSNNESPGFQNQTDTNLVVRTTSVDTIETVVPNMPLEPEVDPRLMDNSINEILVDEDLTLHFSGQGLGSRKLLKQPNILILSDEDGDVIIDICVSRGGRVISATFNERASSLHRKSLVSLAIRKAKDFWFEKSDLIEQCGELRFKITGS